MNIFCNLLFLMNALHQIVRSRGDAWRLLLRHHTAYLLLCGRTVVVTLGVSYCAITQSDSSGDAWRLLLRHHIACLLLCGRTVVVTLGVSYCAVTRSDSSGDAWRLLLRHHTVRK